MRIGNSRIVFGYRGPEFRLYASGANWWQITIPWLRFAFIKWEPRRR